MGEKNKKTSKLKNKVVSSTGWGFLDKGVNFVVQFIIGIILARLLPPSDFGLIGLGMIVIGLGETFVNLGLGPSLIQKKGITERHVRVVLTTSGIAGLILAVAVYAGAPITADILGAENVTPIVKALSVIFIIGGLQIPSRALLIKRMDFQHIFYVSIAKSILYGILTIALALNGFGVWSLVIGSIIKRFVSFVVSYWYIRHTFKPLFARQELFDLAHFGSGMTLSGLFNYFALQGDYFMIGRILGTDALGLYTKAYSLMVKPTTQFISVLTNVLFPAVSKIQEDLSKLRKIFLKSMYTIAFVVIPLCTLLIIVAPELIIGLYGKNWEGAVLPLQILGGFGAFRAMYNSAAAFLRAKGWVYRILGAQIIYAGFMLLLVWSGAKWFGLSGASWGVGISIFIIWCLFMELNCRAAAIQRMRILQTLVPGLIIGISMGLPTILLKYYLAQYTSSYLFLLIILLIAGLIFSIFAIIVLPQKLLYHLPHELLRTVEDYIPKQMQRGYQKLLDLLKKN